MNVPLIFDNETPVHFSPDLAHLLPSRWLVPAHLPPARACMIILAGETARIGKAFTVPPGRDWVLNITFAHGLPAISRDGLVVNIAFACKQVAHPLISIPLGTKATQAPLRACIDLACLGGETGFIEICIGAGTDHDPCGDWLALYELSACPRIDSGLEMARSYAALRNKNELSVFAETYSHSMYTSETSAEHLHPTRGPVAAAPPKPAAVQEATQHLTSSMRVSENAYSFAHRLLETKLEKRPPDFHGRLNSLGKQKGRVRMLSLCSGEARIETSLISACEAPVHITLVDLNPGLLSRAASRLPPNATADVICGNINSIILPQEKFDVIVCVSGLHHVVELERLFAQLSLNLDKNGEIWSIGEYIGANGARLDPRAYDVADGFFASLPEHFRKNRLMPGNPTDAHLPNYDCSSTCFEGIRAVELENLMMRFFDPVELYRRNSFLWRILDQAYCENYDTSRDEDLLLIHQAVDLEYRHFANGGQATELHAIFSRR